MSERKVLNKYFPPDFDPALIPRLRLGRERQYKVRLMAPFSMRCETCGHWIGVHTKFNARKETVANEKFHSMEIYRFYIRCPRCAAEITFKTDPGNLDYVVEKGASRNFEPWRGDQDLKEQLKKEKEEEEAENPIKALENRTEESRREMEILDALDEIRTRNSVQERVNVDKAIENFSEERIKIQEEMLKKQQEQDEIVIKTIFKDADGDRVKRLQNKEPNDVPKFKKFSSLKDQLGSGSDQTSQTKTNPITRNILSKLGIVVKKVQDNKKSIETKPTENPKPQLAKLKEDPIIENMFDGYSSDSS